MCGVAGIFSALSFVLLVLGVVVALCGARQLGNDLGSGAPFEHLREHSREVWVTVTRNLRTLFPRRSHTGSGTGHITAHGIVHAGGSARFGRGFGKLPWPALDAPREEWATALQLRLDYLSDRIEEVEHEGRAQVQQTAAELQHLVARDRAEVARQFEAVGGPTTLATTWLGLLLLLLGTVLQGVAAGLTAIAC